MKKIINIFIAVVLIIVLNVGCSKPASQTSKTKISIVSTIFAPYDFTRQITGDKADITMLLPPSSESHTYEPSPKDRIKIQDCDVFVYVGGESDTWVKEILETIDTSKMQVITLMDCVETLEEELVLGMEEHEHEHEEENKHELDEHVWTSSKNAVLITQKISKAICEADSKNADYYEKNTEDYITKLKELDNKFTEIVALSKRKTLVFGDRFPFRYFAEAYGLDYYAPFSGCSTAADINPKSLIFLIDKVKEENIPVVFHIELSNKKIAEAISEDTNAKVMLFHACHNITKEDFENGVTYIDLMNQNAENLKEALN